MSCNGVSGLRDITTADYRFHSCDGWQISWRGDDIEYDQ